MKKIFALYRGDRFIDMGSKQYLAELLGVTVRTITFYCSPTYQKRNNYKGYVVIRVEED